MHIISYDIASKSLAISIIYFNKNWKSELKTKRDSYNSNISKLDNPIDICKYTINYLLEIDKLASELINLIYVDIIDLIPGEKLKDTTAILRTSRLKSYLKAIDKKLVDLNDDIIVLLEYQMGPNDKSRNVCSQILYHYSDSDSNFSNVNIIDKPNNLHKYKIEILGPSLKNKINFIKETPYSYYTRKYTKLYDANKNHSKENFIYWINKNKMTHMIKNIKKKNLDDIADSFNMAFAWLLFKSGYII